MGQVLAGHDGTEPQPAKPIGNGTPPSTEKLPANLSPIPPSTAADLARAKFIGRMVIGFGILCALVLGISAVTSGQYPLLALSALIVAAALGHYLWMVRDLKRSATPPAEPNLQSGGGAA